MAIALYMDVHVPQSITEQLRRRGVDVLTAFEDETTKLSDDRLLVRVTELKRVLFTQDIRFRVLAETWKIEGKSLTKTCGLRYNSLHTGEIPRYYWN